MCRAFLITVLAAGVLTGQPARAGTISGIVRAQGKEGLDGDAGAGNYSSKALKTAERINYDEMRDFIVYIQGQVPVAMRPYEGA